MWLQCRYMDILAGKQMRVGEQDKERERDDSEDVSRHLLRILEVVKIGDVEA